MADNSKVESHFIVKNLIPEPGGPLLPGAPTAPLLPAAIEILSRSGGPEEGIQGVLDLLLGRAGGRWLGLILPPSTAVGRFRVFAESGDAACSESLAGADLAPWLEGALAAARMEAFPLAPEHPGEEAPHAAAGPEPGPGGCVVPPDTSFRVVRQGGDVLGLLCEVGFSSFFETRPDGRDFESIAALLALPLRCALLDETLARQKLFGECSEELVARMAAGAPESDLFDYLAGFLARVFDTDTVLLYTLTEDRQWLIPAAYHDRRVGVQESVRVRPIFLAENPAALGFLEAGLPVEVPDVSLERPAPGWLGRAAIARIGGLVGVPVSDARGVWGVAVLARERSGSVLGPRELELFRVLMQHSGPLLQNCRMVRALRQSIQSFNLLFETSRDVSSVLDLSEVPRIAARRGLELTASDECVLFFLEPDGATLRPVLAISRHETEALQLERRVGEGIIGQVAKTRVGEYVNRADLDPRHRAIPGVPVEPEALLAAPLLCADRLIGVLGLYKLAGREYTDLELATVTIFATQAAVAIENARLFARMAAEHNRLKAMIQQMEEAVFFCDTRGRVLLVNPAAERLVGGRQAVEGRPFLDIFPPELQPPLGDIERRIRAGGERHVTQEINLGGRVLLAGFTGIHDDNDQGAGMVVLARDITDMKAIEAQLLQSNKMSAVGQLASGVSHEFNNLIAAIYGYAQFMKESRDEKIFRKGIDVILSSSERARDLTRSLLTFSTSTGGHREAVNLNDVVADALLLVEQQLTRDRIRVVRNFDTLSQIRADRGSLQEVFLNLISNARDAMPRGGTLTFTTRQDVSEVVAEVADTGAGIPADDLGRVFDPFFTTKGALGGASTPGTGLGLTTAYNTVIAHGGRLEVSSRVGEGSVFRIVLPLRAGRRSSGAAAA